MKPIEPREDGNPRTVFAGQEEYEPLPATVSVGADAIVTTEWALTDEERALIAAGGAIQIKIWSWGHPLLPLLPAVLPPAVAQRGGNDLS